ncbi:uncharacterized protein LOC119683809 [Teleopsis dalmanni]|uniref:uncharacterized protein LOC119683809 n=1 Tax=Teleopsis dalmanni TaxID=139649 RepID=UPI0018CDBDB0|nr:uncharacterized protein LOC119683809 [Teleopsis dalmanni]
MTHVKHNSLTMRYFIGLWLALIFVAFANCQSSILGDGKPECTTVEEITTRIFRNTWDPTAYWSCSELNVPATLIRCPDQTAFLSSRKECVPWSDWKWESTDQQ